MKNINLTNRILLFKKIIANQQLWYVQENLLLHRPQLLIGCYFETLIKFTNKCFLDHMSKCDQSIIRVIYIMTNGMLNIFKMPSKSFIWNDFNIGK